MKTLISALTLFFMLQFNSFSQETDPNKQLIKTFYKEIFERQKSLEEIVDKYVVYVDSHYQDAVNSVEFFQKGAHESYVASLEENMLSDNIKLVGYEEFKEEDKAKFLRFNPKRYTDIYKLTFSNYPPIYVLVKDHQIESFFGFQKAQGDNYHFIIYH